MPRKARPPLYKMDSSEKARLVSTLTGHLDRIDTIMDPSRAKWTRYIKLYKAIREQETKEFPFVGCSNIFMPEVFNEVSTLTSHFLLSTIRQTPSVHVKPYYKDDAHEREAESWERFLDFYMKEVQLQEHYWRKNLPYLMLLGTHVVKMSMLAEEGRLGWPEVRLSPISLHRFYAYPSITDWRNAPLIGDMAWVPIWRIQEWVAGGYVEEKDFEAIAQWVSTDTAPSDPWLQYRAPDMSIPGEYVDVYDVYMLWSNDDYTKPPEPIRVLFHRKTQIILWAESWKGKPLPYELLYFRADEDNVFGIGLGDLMWTLQEALNTAWNQAIDNSTVANTRVYVAPTGSGVQPNEPIWPGRVIVGPQADKLKAVEIGDVHPSAWAIPTGVKNAMQYTSGATEPFSGMSDTVTKTRHTFSGQAMNVQRQTNRQDLIQAEFEDGLTNVVWHTMDLLVTYASGVDLKVPLTLDAKKRLAAILEEEPAGDVGALLRARLDEDEATLIEGMTFTVPEKVLRREKFEIRVAGRERNTPEERQAAMFISQLVGQYLKQVVELAMLAQQSAANAPMVYQTVLEAWKAANEAMKKVLWSFRFEDAEDILIQLEEVMNSAVNQYGELAAAGLPAGEAAPMGEEAGEGGGSEMGVSFGDMGGAAGITGTAGGSLGGRPSD